MIFVFFRFFFPFHSDVACEFDSAVNRASERQRAEWNESIFIQAIIKADFKSKLSNAILLDFPLFLSAQFCPSD